MKFKLLNFSLIIILLLFTLILFPLEVSGDCFCDLSDQFVLEDSTDLSIVYDSLSLDCNGSVIRLVSYNNLNYILDYTVEDQLVISDLTQDYFDNGLDVILSCDGVNFNFSLEITSVNDPPILEIEDMEVSEGELFLNNIDLRDYVTDVDDDEFIFSLIEENEVNCTISGNYLNLDYSSGWNGITYCTIQVEDMAGAIDNDTFKITVVDLTPPIISGAINSYTGKDWAIISWNTNENSTSEVYYGISSADYIYSKVVSNFTKTHIVNITNLLPSTRYYFKVKSEDYFENYAESSEHKLNTVEDLTPPEIEILSKTGKIELTSINVSVETNKNSYCKYSEVDEDYDLMTNSMSTNNNLVHFFIKSGLKEDEINKYYVRCIDFYNNKNLESKEISFYYYESDVEEIYYSSSSSIDNSLISNDNLMVDLKKRWFKVNKLELLEWEINDSDFSLMKILLKSHLNQNKLELVLRKILSPISRFRHKDIVYEYFGLIVDIGDERRLFGDLEFKVDKRWALANNINKNQIRLFVNNNEWKELETHFKNEDRDYYYFYSMFDTLGLFAISYDPDYVYVEEKLISNRNNNLKNNILKSNDSGMVNEIEIVNETGLLDLEITKQSDELLHDYLTEEDILLLMMQEEKELELDYPKSNDFDWVTILAIILFLFSITGSIILFFRLRGNYKRVIPKEKNKNNFMINNQLNNYFDNPTNYDAIQKIVDNHHQHLSNKQMNNRDEIYDSNNILNNISNKNVIKNDLDYELDKSLNSKEFIKNELKKTYDEIKQKLSNPKSDINLNNKISDKKLSSIENFIVNKFISEGIKKGLSKDMLIQKLKRKGYNEEKISMVYDSMNKTLMLNKKLKDIHDKIRVMVNHEKL